MSMKALSVVACIDLRLLVAEDYDERDPKRWDELLPQMKQKISAMLENASLLDLLGEIDVDYDEPYSPEKDGIYYPMGRTKQDRRKTLDSIQAQLRENGAVTSQSIT